MKLISVLCFAFLVSFSLGRAVEELQDEWTLWKAENGKFYCENDEELERFAIWKSNKVYIEEHNRYSDLFGFTLKINQYADMTSYEFLQSTSSKSHNKDEDHNKDDDKDDDDHDDDDDDKDNTSSQLWGTVGGYFTLPELFNRSKLPQTVDWREEGVVTPVKDQGYCNSAYAFSVTGAIEGAYAVSTGMLEPLSEQNIVDCSVVYGNKGCKGGNREAAMLYILDNDGIDKEKNYPYIASQDTCKFSADGIGAVIRGMVKIKRGNISNLQAAVALVGPITTGIDHQHNAFRFYSSGIFDTRNCSNKKLTHEMLIVGYGKENGKSYWILKNSWGPSWGVNGYMKMIKRNRNQCGIATRAIFPKL